MSQYITCPPDCKICSSHTRQQRSMPLESPRSHLSECFLRLFRQLQTPWTRYLREPIRPSIQCEHHRITLKKSIQYLMTLTCIPGLIQIPCSMSSTTSRRPISSIWLPRHSKTRAGDFTSNTRLGFSDMRSQRQSRRSLSREHIASLTTKAHGGVPILLKSIDLTTLFLFIRGEHILNGVKVINVRNFLSRLPILQSLWLPRTTRPKRWPSESGVARSNSTPSSSSNLVDDENAGLRLFSLVFLLVDQFLSDCIG